MLRQFISFALLLSALTAGAQKIILHLPNNQKVEYEISQLDSITFDEGVYLTCPNDHHPHAIDLGLPSGTKWCCCNVGATKPEGYGGYYAWGETSTKTTYNWSTYKHCDGSYDTMTKYCTRSSYGHSSFTDGKTELDRSDDAATVNMGAPWRMPSVEQMKELYNNCSHQWTQKNGVNGILVTGPSGGQIFLPAAGHRLYGKLKEASIFGSFWSSSFFPYDNSSAYHLEFGSDYWDLHNGSRRGGETVRAVCP